MCCTLRGIRTLRACAPIGRAAHCAVSALRRRRRRRSATCSSATLASKCEPYAAPAPIPLGKRARSYSRTDARHAAARPSARSRRGVWRMGYSRGGVGYSRGVRWVHEGYSRGVGWGTRLASPCATGASREGRGEPQEAAGRPRRCARRERRGARQRQGKRFRPASLRLSAAALTLPFRLALSAAPADRSIGVSPSAPVLAIIGRALFVCVGRRRSRPARYSQRSGVPT